MSTKTSIPNRPMAAFALVASMALGCAGAGWPDEPGVAVDVVHVQNVRAAQAFVETLTSRRLGEAVPEPIVIASRQEGLRPIAQKLQSGVLSAAQAREAAERWGRHVYRRDVEAWILDCSAGRQMWLPGALVHRPAAVISYAAAYFRPRSMVSEQCGLVVVSGNGAEVVTMKALNEI
jgi:hypothetical protein